ncbi:MAG: DNA ligase D [Acidobacteria bacterium]|nr:DNA ligase D [Acidobacteriota bacterium]
MGLKEYQRKRDFRRTPEPAGTPRRRAARRAPAREPGLRFVVQKHDASRLHYDLRLEMEGVLKSWAVPKGPSLDPGVKRLAVHTEDHPLEYRHFEGTIPAGEYGAGTMIVWDRGRWFPEGDPVQAHEKGHLRFRLEGEKLTGGWHLVRTGRRGDPKDEKNWLLFKDADDDARRSSHAAEIVEQLPQSVSSGRTIEELAAGAKPRRGTKSARRAPAPDPAGVPGARKAPLPASIAPQLATLVQDAPPGEDWLHEIKYDGYRALCRIDGRSVVMTSRRGQDWTAKFGRIPQQARELAVRQAILDGEVVVLDEHHRSSFQALQNALGSGARGTELLYYAFDLLYLDGHDLSRAPLLERKKLLGALLEAAPRDCVIRYSDHVQGQGPAFYAEACRHGLEGIVSKLAHAPHRSTRTREWLKVKCSASQEFVIGGFTDPQGQRTGIGALLVGVHEPDGRLRYAGKVGTGFTEKLARELRARLDALAQTECPFANEPPRAIARRAHWVKPRLVGEVTFTEWTRDGVLRHPSFKGLREDKRPQEAIVERPQPVPARAAAKRGDETVHGVRLSHPDRVLYPAQGITKRELAEFYVAIADRILPHVGRRPLTLVRCPEGHAKFCFYQKHDRGDFPDPVRTVAIQEQRKVGVYPYIDSVESMVALVQLGTLEFHVWGSRIDNIERPDRIVFDLDPDAAVAWDAVVEAALALRERLAALKLTSFAKTTGGKGLHVVVPIERRSSWDEVRSFSEAIATEMAGREPKKYVAVMSKARRKGKIFIDYLRNARGAIAVAAYSTRAREGAPVSTPVTWDEVEQGVRADAFHVRNLPDRLRSLGRDPWHGIEKLRQRLPRR